MGEPAKVAKIAAEEPKASAKPDMNQPISLFYWKTPLALGNSTQSLIMVGGAMNDHERTSGKVTEILFYPQSGVVIIEVQPFALAGVNTLPSDEKKPKKYMICQGAAHGSVLTTDNIDELARTGRL
mgnify:CR=1 FL=1